MGREDFSEVEAEKEGLAREQKPGWSWVGAYTSLSAPLGKGVATALLSAWRSRGRGLGSCQVISGLGLPLKLPPITTKGL